MQSKDKHGITPLMVLVANAHFEVISLLSRGSDLDLTDDFGRNVLHFAVRGGCSACVGELISKGASLKHMSIEGFTPVSLAAKYGRTSMLETMQEQTKNLELDPAPSSCGPLHKAAAYGHLETAKWLLDKGANVEAENSFKASALMVAADNGYHSIVKLLLGRGASVDHKTPDNFTALHCAIRANRLDIVKELLNSGARTDILHRNRTILDFARSRKINKEIITYLSGVIEQRKCEYIDGNGETLMQKFCGVMEDLAGLHLPLFLKRRNGHGFL